MKKTTWWFALIAVPLAIIYWLWFALVYSFVLTIKQLTSTYRMLKYKPYTMQSRIGRGPVFTGPSYCDDQRKKRHRRGHRGGKKHHKHH